MKIDDTPRARSKNLDVLKEWESVEKKNEANFVVIGMLTLLYHLASY
jgi:elongation factor 1 alpha-like protein